MDFISLIHKIHFNVHLLPAILRGSSKVQFQPLLPVTLKRFLNLTIKDYAKKIPRSHNDCLCTINFKYHLLKECLGMYLLFLIPTNSFQFISSAPHKSNANIFLSMQTVNHIFPHSYKLVQIFNIYLKFLTSKAPSIM